MLAPGARLGRFVIARQLGEGGMGTVYEARDPELGRAVAIKLLRDDRADPTRLLREAQALATLSHPNVVAVYELGTHGDQVFVAMERIDGVSLDRHLAAAPRRWPAIVAWYVQAGRGLAAVHARTLVHRDFKPSNLLIDDAGRVRVSDFGLARLDRGDAAATGGGAAPRRTAGDDAADLAVTVDAGEPDRATPAPPSGERALLASTLTATGAVIGTPRYMAPEQHAGERVTRRADQFAFCVALWEGLYGEHPFSDGDRGTLRDAVIAGQRRAAPRGLGVPAWIERALVRGLARDPAARWPSMDALCDQLERAPVQRRRVAIGLGAVVVLAGASVVAWQLSSRAPARVACGGAGDGVALVWNDAARARLRAGFAPVTGFGADTATRTIAAADAWAGRWRDTRIDACRATHERGAQSAAVLDRRMACLDRELAHAGAVLGGLAAGGPRVVAGSLAAIDALPSPEACDASRVQAAMPVPDDARVAAMRADLAAMRAASLAGDVAEARRRVAAARVTAEALGHPGLRAEVLLEYSSLFEGQDPKAAMALREQALADAVTAGDRDLEATATVRLLEAATQIVDVKAIGTLLPIARAAIARGDVVPAFRRAFQSTEARALVRLGKWDDALAACDRLAETEAAPQVRTAQCRCGANLSASRADEAIDRCQDFVAAAEQAYGASHPSTADALSNLSLALGRRGRNDDALAIAERARAIAETAYGADSAEVATQLANGNTVLISLGRLDEAVARAERVVAIRTAHDAGTASRLTGHAEQQLGEILVRQGRAEDGLLHADRALAIFEQAIPAGHPDLVRLYAVHGNIHLQAERWPAAERSMRRCAEIALAVYGEHHLLRASCLLGLAQYHLADHRPDDAIDGAEQALAVFTALGAAPINIANAHGVLGRALGESGDRRGARQHLDQAITAFDSLGPGAAVNAAEARRQRKRF